MPSDGNPISSVITRLTVWFHEEQTPRGLLQSKTTAQTYRPAAGHCRACPQREGVAQQPRTLPLSRTQKSTQRKNDDISQCYSREPL